MHHVHMFSYFQLCQVIYYDNHKMTHCYSVLFFINEVCDLAFSLKMHFKRTSFPFQLL